MSRRVALAVVLSSFAITAAVVAVTASGQLGDGSNDSASPAAFNEVVRGARLPDSLPIEVIVVLSAPSVAQAAANDTAAPAEVAQSQHDAIVAARAAGIPLRIHQTFHNALNGFSAYVPRTDIGRLPSIPGVSAVYPVRRVYPAGVVESSLAALGAAAKPEVPALAATGKGVSVALLDGPLDTSHPYLAGTALPSWNAVTGEPREDDPTPDAARHATYMAGIIAGSGGPAGLGGVAPGAKILPVQVMAMDRGVLVGTTSSLLAGIDRALDPNGDGNLSDHAGVIVAPVSEPFAAFGDTPEALAADGAARAGSLVIAAAGNDGPTGARFGTIATPASAASWLAVGASDGRATLPSVGLSLDTGGQSQTLQAVPLAGMLAPIADTPVDVADLAGPSASNPDRGASESASGDAAGDYQTTDGTGRVTGKAVLIPRDGGAIGPRVVAAAAAGAKAVLLYGDGPIANGALGLDDRVSIPVAVLPGFAGTLLAKAVDAGGDATVTFGQSIAPANANEGAVSGFSSTGLGYGGALKPDLVAPGVAITSSLAGGGYGAVTGTSAAAAEVAGDAAVLLEAHPTWTVDQLRGALVGTAAATGVQGTSGLTLDPVEAQGGGAVDPVAASSTALVATPTSLSFGLAGSDPFSASLPLVLQNVSDQPVSVHLGFVRDGVGDAGITADVTADQPELTIPANSSSTLHVTLSLTGLSHTASVIGGWVTVTTDGTQTTLRVPWAAATAGDAVVNLIKAAGLTSTSFAPGDSADPPSQLQLQLGDVQAGVGGTDSRLAIAPVARLTVDLFQGDTDLGRLLDLRSLLPGVYRFGVTGRGLSGAPLAPGAYHLVVDATSVDSVTSERDLPFTVSG
jgi:subtilisin family serine protease